ncbi:hypothetical protein OH491_13710 [Termitidicoccus mucosus]|uniref:Transmembrane Fragile-X-F protein n=1 Tax=Termitidicoccus mucosus TaxID=1184151 RepID=A0A178IJF8_9BACT|nr:hypothetical protein AW736_13745 [Opitutaceae bacterium TSB47]
MKTKGVSFLSLLGLLFIGLKLGGAIGWSWWWVLAPLWMPAALAAFLFMLIGIIAVICDGDIRKYVRRS